MRRRGITLRYPAVRAPNPWALPARIVHGDATHDVRVIPDKVFGLDFTEARKRSYFFVEADRATAAHHETSHPRHRGIVAVDRGTRLAPNRT